MRRPLGNMETAFQVTRRIGPMSVAGVVRIRNAPGPDRISDALGVLARHHPLLGARIVGTSDGPAFETGPDVPEIPFRVVPMADERHWQRLAEETINADLDVDTGPLLACTYLQGADGSGADLVFAYDHSIMDAASAAHLYGRLLGLAAGTLEPSRFPPGDGIPPPIDGLLPDRLAGLGRLLPTVGLVGRQMGDEIGYRIRSSGAREPIHERAACRTVVRTLDRDTTHRLVRRARDHRLTMNSVAVGALLSATHHRLHREQAIPLRAISFADLRPLLQPSPSEDVLGCYIAMLRHTVPIAPGDDLWTIAGSFQRRVRASRRRDEPLLMAGMAKQVMGMIAGSGRMRMGSAAVSYAGPVGLAPRHGDIEVTDVHGFISNNRLGPVSTAFVEIFRGRLVWNFVFLDTDMDGSTAGSIADDVVRLLTVETG